MGQLWLQPPFWAKSPRKSPIQILPVLPVCQDIQWYERRMEAILCIWYSPVSYLSSVVFDTGRQCFFAVLSLINSWYILAEKPCLTRNISNRVAILFWGQPWLFHPSGIIILLVFMFSEVVCCMCGSELHLVWRKLAPLVKYFTRLHFALPFRQYSSCSLILFRHLHARVHSDVHHSKIGCSLSQSDLMCGGHFWY